MRWIAALVLLLSGQAYAQTCDVPPIPQPRDSAILRWNAPARSADGRLIPPDAILTYVVYERIDGLDERRCTTRETTAAMLGLTVGLHEWRVAAMTGTSDPPWMASAMSNPWSKTILGFEPDPEPDPEPVATGRWVPGAPTNLTGE